MELLTKCVENTVKPSWLGLNEINAKIASLTKVKNSLYGFERDASKEIQNKIDHYSGLKKTVGMEYPRFVNLDMLKWLDKDGLPRIVLFPLDDNTFKIYARAGSDGYLGSALPDKLRACYFESAARQSRKCGEAPWKDWSFTISCSYSGVFPETTRAKIKAAQKKFGNDNVFIMAEAKGWVKSDVVKNPITGDPLVVGWDGHNLWLVDRFDLTTIESVIAAEFTEMPDGSQDS